MLICIATLVSVFELQLFPVRLNGFFVVGDNIAVDMRMAEDEFVAYSMKHIRYIKCLPLGGDARVKHQVEHQVAELFFYFAEVCFKNGVGQLIGLFDGQMSKRFQCLFFVPGAVLAQVIHNCEQTIKGFEFFRAICIGRCDRFFHMRLNSKGKVINP